MKHVSFLNPVARFAAVAFDATLCVVALWAWISHAGPETGLTLNARARTRAATDTNSWEVATNTVRWEARKTAIIVCDMWDRHWCSGATARVGEMAPRMNAVLKEARSRGVLIIHAPSDTMGYYENFPQRRAARQAPKAEAPPGLDQWRSLNSAKEAPLPIDDSDGGCNEDPQCKQGGVWKHEVDALEIADVDIVTDRGDEVYNVLQARGIENVIVMGVHTNMCVLGRPFSIRQMVSLGKHVVLMRDMTDTMYNSRMRPWVSHFAGTDLVVEHIEKYWCPSVTSADILGGEPFRFREDARPHVVFLISEPEYDTKRTLPEFARADLAWRGFRTTIIHGEGKNGDDFAGLETLPDADLLVISVRRHTPAPQQLEFVRRHLAAGKPLVGIRTASHAFDADPADSAHAKWGTFDVDTLGGHYLGHYNNKAGGGADTVVTLAEGGATHPILNGFPREPIHFGSHLYKNRDMAPTTRVLLRGSVGDQGQNEPLAWVNTASQRRVFYTSLGSAEDFNQPAFRTLLRNGILWALNKPVPPR